MQGIDAKDLSAMLLEAMDLLHRTRTVWVGGSSVWDNLPYPLPQPDRQRRFSIAGRLGPEMRQSVRQLIVVLLASVNTVVAKEAAKPIVTARVSLEAQCFFGAVPRAEAFVVLVDDTLYAFSMTGRNLWKTESQWSRFPKPQGEELVQIFNRPAPVAFADGTAVLNCRDWRLALEIFGISGQRTATIRPLSHDMQLQHGILTLGRAGDSLVLGYRLSSSRAHDNPDRGLLVFDAALNKRREYDAWGDRICCGEDGSVYAPTVRWGKDLKWCRFLPDGSFLPLPASVSGHTWVLEPGKGGRVILWGSREDSTARRPDGNLDSIGTRQIWHPSQSDAQVIHEFWRSWQGEIVPCTNGRYILRIWPDSRQEFVCLNSQGKALWQHKLILSCYFWPPSPLCGPDGKVYVMDTTQGPNPDTHNVVLRCLSPLGSATWELIVDHTSRQPRFASLLSASGSHVLFVREDLRDNVELILVALPNVDENRSSEGIEGAE